MQHLSPQKTVLRDPAEGPTSQRTGPRGAAARVLTKRLKLLRNIASKVGGAELRSAGLVWEGAVHRTHCGVGSWREAHGRQATRPPARRLQPPPPS